MKKKCQKVLAILTFFYAILKSMEITDRKVQSNSAVIYARVSERLKEELDNYASEKGTTLTTAVCDLIERGLVSVSDESSISQLESKNAELTLENMKLNGEIQILKAELQPLKSLSERSRMQIGKCPQCKGSITGYDLLAIGRCQKCQSGLSSLLADQQASSALDQKEFLLMIGALGAVIGIALLVSG